MSLSLTAIVVSHDSAGILPGCLEAFRQSGIPAIVVDNASKDDSAAVARAHGASVIENHQNEGYGRANNRGIRAAATEYVLIANPDLMLDEAALSKLGQAVENYPDAGLYAPRIIEEDGRIFFKAQSLLSSYLRNDSGRLLLPEGDCCAPFFSGACLLVRREEFLALGGFDENIFLFYEDDDLCRRIADKGRALIWVHGAVARHGRGRSSAPKKGRIFRSRWHQAWSRAYVSRKYGLPSPALMMFLANGLKAIGAACLFNRNLRERYGGSAAGAWAALRGIDALVYEGLDKEGGR